MIIGILAIQGGFAKHQEMLSKMGVKTLLVKTSNELDQVEKLIIPGGESTTMRILLKKHNLWDDLKQFCKTKPVFGTCAGAILLANAIDNDKEETLDAIDININRNSYGRQVDSFETVIDINWPKPSKQPTSATLLNSSIPATFIRAPQITRVGDDVEILAQYNQQPVLVQQENVLVATFHPELTNNTTIIDYFITHM